MCWFDCLLLLVSPQFGDVSLERDMESNKMLTGFPDGF